MYKKFLVVRKNSLLVRNFTHIFGKFVSDHL